MLCSGVYGDKVHDSLFQWLDSIDKKKLKESVKFHLFLTWFGGKYVIRKDHPNGEDLSKALEWLGEQVKI